MDQIFEDDLHERRRSAGMTDELERAAIEVVLRRETADEARAEVKAIEQAHRSSYDARRVSIAAEADAVAAAKAVRLALYHAALENGEWSPGEDRFGLSVEQHEVLEYDPEVALTWLLMAAQSHHQGATVWLKQAFATNRAAFEAIAKRERLPFVHPKQEPRVTIAHDSLPAKIAASADAESRAAEEASDAIADTARKLAG